VLESKRRSRETNAPMGILRENPVLAKEVRSRLRARRQSRASRVAAFVVVGLVVAILYYYGLVALFSGNSQSNGEGLYIFFTLAIELTIILFLTPSLAAAAITQEREQQTWNALLLSRLTTGEIVFGKFFAALLPALIIMGLFFPLKALAAYAATMPLHRYLLSNALLLATVMFYTAVSLFWSWRCKRTFVATSASFGSVLLFVIGTFVFFGLFSVGRSGSSVQPEEFVPLWVNPYMAMWWTLEPRNNNVPIGIVCLVFYLLSALILTLVVTRRLTYGAKELEQ
jgi:ABC-type transport system involved in multi-copper enzyme maturation permease subunit